MASEPPGGASPLDPRSSAVLGLQREPRAGAKPSAGVASAARQPSSLGTAYLRRGARISALSIMAIRASRASMTVTLRIILVAHAEQPLQQHPDTPSRPHDSSFNRRAASAICTKLSFAKSHRLAPKGARQQRSGAAERAPAPQAAARPGQRRTTMPEVSPSPTGPAPPGDSIILEEEIDPNYVPSQDEIDEYAKWLGMDLSTDKDLQWIAREGLKAPLPEHWKPCKTTDTDEIYYFNFSSGESTWDHPCDEYYRTLYEVPPRRPAVHH